MNTDHFGEYVHYRLQPRLPNMRRFTIAVEIQSEEDVFRFRSALTKVSNVLFKLPDLDYVHIKLCIHDEYGGEARESYQALHSAAIHMHERAAVALVKSVLPSTSS